MTVGQLIEALKDNFKPLSERLIEYTCGKLPEEEFKKHPGVSVLDDDPRQKPMQLCALTPHSDHYILERADAIDLIWTKFQSFPQEDSIGTVIMVGDPGTGKSQIARQFGKRYFEEQVDNGRSVVVFTLHAGNLEELYHSYLEFAQCLGIEKMDSIHNVQGDSYQSKLDLLMMIVGEKLCNFRDWLVIVDNVENLTETTDAGRDIFTYVPYSSNGRTNNWGRGKVLITMQQPGKFTDSACRAVIHQEDFKISLHSAVQLLVKVESGYSWSTLECKDVDIECAADAEEVVEMLERLPLALVSAAAYKRLRMKENSSYSWKQYLREFDKAMKYSFGKRQYHHRSLSTAVEITLRKMCESVIFQLAFVVLAYCECKNVPEDLIKEYVRKVKGKWNNISDSVGLAECPLLSHTKSDYHSIKGGRSGKFYHMHGVTHVTLKQDILPKWSSFVSAPVKYEPDLQTLLQVVLTYQQSLEKVSDLWTLSYLTPHIFAIGQAGKSEYERSGCQWCEIPEVLFIAVESSKVSLKSSKDLKECMEDCLNLARNIDTVPKACEAKYKSCLGKCTAESGNIEDGRKLGYEALEMMENANAEAKDFAYSLITLSWNLRPDYERGIATIKRNIDRVRNECGEKSIEFATLLFQLGDLVKRYDRFTAREYFEKSCFIFEERGDFDSLEYTTAASYYCRFLLTSWSSADTKKAAEIGEILLKITKEVLNENTMKYINKCSTMGRTLMSSFQPREAISVLEPLIEKVKLHQRPEAQWRVQQPMWIAHAVLGETDKALFYLKENIRLADEYSIDVGTGDRYGNRMSFHVLSTVDCLTRPFRRLSPTMTIICRIAVAVVLFTFYDLFL
jgi:tetratricopeptide (TPR) repeat protein